MITDDDIDWDDAFDFPNEQSNSQSKLVLSGVIANPEEVENWEDDFIFEEENQNVQSNKNIEKSIHLSPKGKENIEERLFISLKSSYQYIKDFQLMFDKNQKNDENEDKKDDDEWKEKCNILEKKIESLLKKSLNNSEEYINLSFEIGNIYHDHQYTIESMKYFNNILEWIKNNNNNNDDIKKKNLNFTLSELYFKMGLNAKIMKDLLQSIDYLKNSIYKYNENNNNNNNNNDKEKYMLIRCYYEIGDCYFKLEKYIYSLDYYNGYLYNIIQMKKKNDYIINKNDNFLMNNNDINSFYLYVLSLQRISICTYNLKQYHISKLYIDLSIKLSKDIFNDIYNENINNYLPKLEEKYNNDDYDKDNQLLNNYNDNSLLLYHNYHNNYSPLIKSKQKIDIFNKEENDNNNNNNNNNNDVDDDDSWADIDNCFNNDDENEKRSLHNILFLQDNHHNKMNEVSKYKLLPESEYDYVAIKYPKPSILFSIKTKEGHRSLGEKDLEQFIISIVDKYKSYDDDDDYDDDNDNDNYDIIYNNENDDDKKEKMNEYIESFNRLISFKTFKPFSHRWVHSYTFYCYELFINGYNDECWKYIIEYFDIYLKEYYKNNKEEKNDNNKNELKMKGSRYECTLLLIEILSLIYKEEKDDDFEKVLKSLSLIMKNDHYNILSSIIRSETYGHHCINEDKILPLLLKSYKEIERIENNNKINDDEKRIIKEYKIRILTDINLYMSDRSMITSMVQKISKDNDDENDYNNNNDEINDKIIIDDEYRIKIMEEIYINDIKPYSLIKCKAALSMGIIYMDVLNDYDKSERILFESIYMLYYIKLSKTMNMIINKTNNNNNYYYYYNNNIYSYNDIFMNSLKTYGDILMKNYKYKYAISVYDASLMNLKVRKKIKEYYNLMRYIAEISLKEDDIIKSISLYKEILLYYKKEKRINESIYIYEILSNLYDEIGYLNESIYCLEEASKLLPDYERFKDEINDQFIIFNKRMNSNNYKNSSSSSISNQINLIKKNKGLGGGIYNIIKDTLSQSLDPGFIKIKLDLAKIYLKSYEYDKSIDILEKLSFYNHPLINFKLMIYELLSKAYLKKRLLKESNDYIDKWKYEVNHHKSLLKIRRRYDFNYYYNNNNNYNMDVFYFEMKSKICFHSNQCINALKYIDSAILLTSASMYKSLGYFYYLRGKILKKMYLMMHSELQINELNHNIHDYNYSSSNKSSFQRRSLTIKGGIHHNNNDSSYINKNDNLFDVTIDFRMPTDILQECIMTQEQAYHYFKTIGNDYMIAKSVSLISEIYLEYLFWPIALNESNIDDMTCISYYEPSIIARNVREKHHQSAVKVNQTQMINNDDIKKLSSNNNNKKKKEKKIIDRESSMVILGRNKDENNNRPLRSNTMATVVTPSQKSSLIKKDFIIDLSTIENTSVLSLEISIDVSDILLSLNGYLNMAELRFIEGEKEISKLYWEECVECLSIYLFNGQKLVLNESNVSFIEKVYHIVKRCIRMLLFLPSRDINKYLYLIDSYLLLEYTMDHELRRKGFNNNNDNDENNNASRENASFIWNHYHFLKEQRKKYFDGKITYEELKNRNHECLLKIEKLIEISKTNEIERLKELNKKFRQYQTIKRRTSSLSNINVKHSIKRKNNNNNNNNNQNQNDEDESIKNVIFIFQMDDRMIHYVPSTGKKRIQKVGANDDTFNNINIIKMINNIKTLFVQIHLLDKNEESLTVSIPSSKNVNDLLNYIYDIIISYKDDESKNDNDESTINNNNNNNQQQTRRKKFLSSLLLSQKNESIEKIHVTKSFYYELKKLLSFIERDDDHLSLICIAKRVRKAKGNSKRFLFPLRSKMNKSIIECFTYHEISKHSLTKPLKLYIYLNANLSKSKSYDPSIANTIQFNEIIYNYLSSLLFKSNNIQRKNDDNNNNDKKMDIQKIIFELKQLFYPFIEILPSSSSLNLICSKYMNIFPWEMILPVESIVRYISFNQYKIHSKQKDIHLKQSMFMNHYPFNYLSFFYSNWNKNLYENELLRKKYIFNKIKQRLKLKSFIIKNSPSSSSSPSSSNYNNNNMIIFDHDDIENDYFYDLNTMDKSNLLFFLNTYPYPFHSKVIRSIKKIQYYKNKYKYITWIDILSLKNINNNGLPSSSNINKNIKNPIYLVSYTDLIEVNPFIFSLICDKIPLASLLFIPETHVKKVYKRLNKLFYNYVINNMKESIDPLSFLFNSIKSIMNELKIPIVIMNPPSFHRTNVNS